MRVSQGIPVGAKAKLYDPDSFHDREEVIIYSREEFKRTYVAMHNQVHDIFLMERLWDQEDNKKLMGQWYWIMGKIHIINSELDSFLSAKPSQSYLDAYLHSPIKKREDNGLGSLIKLASESRKAPDVGLDFL
ncbi:MAG TPA: hypothetical protein GXZ72_07900 [Methanobacterium sp.]|jgi:hypothetical protein|nr:hypothetical protein [Methanobacterium sp.]